MIHAATYQRLRAEPLWKLLASDNGPAVIALLEALLHDKDKNLPASVFHDRLARLLEELRAQGENFPQTAQQYAAGWLAEGYLERRFPPGVSEEEYQLSTDAVEALRFVGQMGKPRITATESRLSLVIGALSKLAEDTDTDKFRRVDRLMAEQDRLQREIDAIQSGQMRVLPHAVALERVREVLQLAEDLISDFRKVRDRFGQLNRELRERILDTEGNRGEVLDSLFAGIDLISESDAGRTFQAFWRLLTDPEQSAALESALDSIMERDFSGELEFGERKFLLGMTRALLEQGGDVHETLQSFARSLRNFVQSREYLEQRLIQTRLAEAQKAAVALKDEIRAAESLEFTLALTGSRLGSISQWVLYDPSLEARTGPMPEGEALALGIDIVGDLVARSEIDFRALLEDIRAALAEKEQVSVAEVLERFPARQGLGSVIGLISLASRHGIPSGSDERAVWTGGDGVRRSARLPRIYFVRERIDELG
jgi:hypothetical protein